MNSVFVNANHQNGMYEYILRDLQELARTKFIHAAKRCPNNVTTNLWTYAIHMANGVLNETPRFQNNLRQTSQQVFSYLKVQPNQKHWKPFGCPVYVLAINLKSGHIHHKWKEWSRVGIYRGRSPQHFQSVALVLDQNTEPGQPSVSPKL